MAIAVTTATKTTTVSTINVWLFLRKKDLHFKFLFCTHKRVPDILLTLVNEQKLKRKLYMIQTIMLIKYF